MQDNKNRQINKCKNIRWIIYYLCVRTDAKEFMELINVLVASKSYIDAGADMIFP